MVQHDLPQLPDLYQTPRFRPAFLLPLVDPLVSHPQSPRARCSSRDKLNLDLFWLKDRSLTDADALPAPDILAQEIADDLEAALEQFTKIAARLGRPA